MIERELATAIRQKLDGGKAIVLMGARQTGKTTLLRALFGDDTRVVWLSGDEPDVRALFKWNPTAKAERRPWQFLKAYPDSAFEVVHPGNFEAFLSE